MTERAASDRKSRVLSGLATDFSGTAVLMLVNLAATPLMLLYLSGSGYGFWVVALQVMALLGLLDFSLGLGLLKFASDPAIQRADRFEAFVSTAFFSYCAMGLLVLIGGLAVTPWIPGWFNIPREEARVVQTAFRLSVVTTSLTLPLSTFQMLLRSVQRLALANVLGFLTALLSTAFALALLIGGVGLLALPLGALIAIALTGSAGIVLAQRYAPPFRLRPQLVNQADLGLLWSYGAALQAVRVANTVASNTDGVVISSVIGAAAVTPYSLTMKLPNLLGAAIASKLPGQMMPAIAELFALDDRERLRRLFLGLTRTMARFGVLAATFVMIANQPFVAAWVGADRFAGWSLLAVFAILTLVDSVIRGTAIFLWMSSAVGSFAVASAIETALNIGLSLALVGPLGVVGVAMGTVVSRAAVTGPFIAYRGCRLFGISLAEYIASGLAVPFAKSMPTVVMAGLVHILVPTNFGWGFLPIAAAACALPNFLMFDAPRLLRMPRPVTASGWVRALVVLD